MKALIIDSGFPQFKNQKANIYDFLLFRKLKKNIFLIKVKNIMILFP